MAVGIDMHGRSTFQSSGSWQPWLLQVVGGELSCQRALGQLKAVLGMSRMCSELLVMHRNRALVCEHCSFIHEPAVESL